MNHRKIAESISLTVLLVFFVDCLHRPASAENNSFLFLVRENCYLIELGKPGSNDRVHPEVVTVTVVVILTDKTRDSETGFARNVEPKGSKTSSKPIFEEADARVVAVAGSDVILPCSVRHLNDKLVSWIRRKDLHILTSGPIIFTADDRFRIRDVSKATDWSLGLRKAQKSDSGEYECQINTDPKMSRLITLDIVSVSDLKSYPELPPKGSPGLPTDLDLRMVDDEGVSPLKGETLTRVLGKKEQYVKAGSTITFTCLVVSPGEPVVRIEWLKNGRQVSFQASRGGIIVDTEKSGTKATSRLTLADVKMDDSGNYTCQPENFKSHSVMLIVVAEERTEAMKRHKNSGHSPMNRNWKYFLVVFLFINLS